MDLFSDSMKKELKDIIFEAIKEYHEKEIAEEKVEDEVLTIADAAIITKYSKSYITKMTQKLEKDGGIPCITIGKSKRIYKKDVQKWLEKHKNNSSGKIYD